jgi:hypothetical protein
MRAYVAVTGILFAVLVAAHAARMVVEPRLIHDPTYWFITGLGAVFAVWALVVLLRGKRA